MSENKESSRAAELAELVRVVQMQTTSQNGASPSSMQSTGSFTSAPFSASTSWGAESGLCESTEPDIQFPEEDNSDFDVAGECD